ncbi:uncharacterized protein [Triticum aestivum]|uniref:uncharacterized protein n=1 Tax=Triticum aestivum TaxID=4565 RepID=UPI001D02303A|nr:uncharacterized protein LOC123186136 [Triticum aestivum]
MADLKTAAYQADHVLENFRYEALWRCADDHIRAPPPQWSMISKWRRIMKRRKRMTGTRMSKLWRSRRHRQHHCGSLFLGVGFCSTTITAAAAAAALRAGLAFVLWVLSCCAPA